MSSGSVAVTISASKSCQLLSCLQTWQLGRSPAKSFDIEITALTFSKINVTTPLISCVAFDAVGTLIYPEPSVSRAYWQIGQRFGTRMTLEAVSAAFHVAFNKFASGVRKDFSTSEVEERERWRLIVQDTLPDVIDPTACFDELHAHFAKPTAWRSFPDVAETLQALTQRGIQIVVASNFDERLHPVCDELPELKLLQRRIISASIGWHKPSPQFYDHLVREAECPPEQILMVGDDWLNDVVSAREAGLQAVLIDRKRPAESQDVITDLRHLTRPGAILR